MDWRRGKEVGGEKGAPFGRACRVPAVLARVAVCAFFSGLVPFPAASWIHPACPVAYAYIQTTYVQHQHPTPNTQRPTPDARGRPCSYTRLHRRSVAARAMYDTPTAEREREGGGGGGGGRYDGDDSKYYHNRITTPETRFLNPHSLTQYQTSSLSSDFSLPSSSTISSSRWPQPQPRPQHSTSASHPAHSTSYCTLHSPA